MLRWIIGEDVEMILCPHPLLGRVKADAGQVEQIIMNLVVNARDAMPEGGEIRVETMNVEFSRAYAETHQVAEPGPYVILSVSDTGCGMDEETQARIFEPFFTTKCPGKGTGLGLATVYGIVNQSGGSIEVASTPGKGTTFKIYFPRVEEEPDRSESAVASDNCFGSETILIVEDDEMVRALAQTILEQNGYAVLAVRNGTEALHLVEDGSKIIHLILTDTIMPGMNGRELAERILAIRPAMKVLYMSGYTDKVFALSPSWESESAFMQKPFTPQTLTRKVRDVLASPQLNQGRAA